MSSSAPLKAGPGRRLILARHGQSTSNARNIFTGWSDPPLTEAGEKEARKIGQSLRAAGATIDRVFTSAFVRTRRTADIILQTLGLDDCPQTSDPALNERDYGELTGLDKDQARARWGEAQVRTWRRSYTEGPPHGESLKDTAARVLPFYLRTILPAVMQDRSVLIIAHGNTLRALIMALDGLSPQDVEALEIATGEVVVYDLAADTSIERKTALGAAENVMAKDDGHRLEQETDREFYTRALQEEVDGERGVDPHQAQSRSDDVGSMRSN